jgi:hypothetical protein
MTLLVVYENEHQPLTFYYSKRFLDQTCEGENVYPSVAVRIKFTQDQHSLVSNGHQS